MPAQVCPSRVTNISAIAAKDKESRMKGNTHADTTFIGAGALELYDHCCPVGVQTYDLNLGVRNHRTIGTALAFGHPFTGRRYHMIWNQSIDMTKKLTHHLLCLNQVRAAGWTVNEADPNEESHSIVCEDEYGEKVVIPLFLKGVTSYFNVEPLTRDKFEAHDCPRITMTNKDMTWGPKL